MYFRCNVFSPFQACLQVSNDIVLVMGVKHKRKEMLRFSPEVFPYSYIPILVLLAAVMAALHPLSMEAQTLESWGDPAYWEEACPWLSARRDTQAEHAAGNDGASDDGGIAGGSINDNLAKSLATSLGEHGFIHLTAEALGPLLDRDNLVARLARGVTRLVELGFTPSSICMYDEHWELVRRLAPLLEAVTGNTPSGDIFTFHRSAAPDGMEKTANTSGFGSSPHRDKPNAGRESFRADGAAMYCTVWVALTDATPVSSCLYVIPKEHDTGYDESGNQLGAALGAAAGLYQNYQNIRALPTDAGGACVFSHRLVHWGSRPATSSVGGHAPAAPTTTTAGAVAGTAAGSAAAPPPATAVRPRMAMSYALADNAEFDIGEYFDHAFFSPFPPLQLRVALRAAQSILFSHQKPFPKGGLGYATRLWRRGSQLFMPNYKEKVNAACQWQKFMKGR